MALLPIMTTIRLPSSKKSICAYKDYNDLILCAYKDYNDLILCAYNDNLLQRGR